MSTAQPLDFATRYDNYAGRGETRRVLTARQHRQLARMDIRARVRKYRRDTGIKGWAPLNVVPFTSTMRVW